MSSEPGPSSKVPRNPGFSERLRQVTGAPLDPGIGIQNPVHGDSARGGNYGQTLEWSSHWNPFLEARDMATCAFPNGGTQRAEPQAKWAGKGFPTHRTSAGARNGQEPRNGSSMREEDAESQKGEVGHCITC